MSFIIRRCLTALLSIVFAINFCYLIECIPAATNLKRFRVIEQP